jgi:hypothetical protein
MSTVVAAILKPWGNKHEKKSQQELLAVSLMDFQAKAKPVDSNIRLKCYVRENALVSLSFYA